MGIGGANRNRMLTVMRDFRLGTFGGAALVMAPGLKVIALTALSPLAISLALIAGHGLSRLSCIVVMQTGAYVRQSGAATAFAERLGPAG